MANIDRQGRDFVHILCKSFPHVSLFPSPLFLCSLNVIKSQTKWCKKNAGFLECCHGSRLKLRPTRERSPRSVCGKRVSPSRGKKVAPRPLPAVCYSFPSTIARSLITLSLPLASIRRFSLIRSSRLWNRTVCTLFSAIWILR